jgi:hypothetical protein
MRLRHPHRLKNLSVGQLSFGWRNSQARFLVDLLEILINC